MSNIGQISLRDRVFQVKGAAVARQGGNWNIEIERMRRDLPMTMLQDALAAEHVPQLPRGMRISDI